MLLHLFNPGHETAVLTNQVNYTPASNVCIMQRDLALLPMWYGEEKDQIYVEETPDPLFLTTLYNWFGLLPQPITKEELTSSPLPLRTASPWGISPQILHRFRDIQQTTGAAIAIPDWEDTFRKLVGRQTAIECLDKIRIRLDDLSIPESPVLCYSMEEIKQFIVRHTPPVVLKTPYSSSGRGLLWLQDLPAPSETAWLSGALRRQKCITIEQGLDKIQDFAMEFYRDEQGKVVYKGLSVFDTDNKGNYSGSRIESQESLLKTLTSAFPGEKFERIKTVVSEVLEEVYTLYSGYLGVDMMIYRKRDGDLVIHPCIEINMRNTMGMVSIQLFERFIHPKSKGMFYIRYDKDAFALHQQMKTAYPLVTDQEKIVKGYLSLCPVTEQTFYRAYLLIE